MRIAIIGTAYPLRGGLASYNERLAKALMDKGHEVIIYTFTLQYPSFLFPGKTQYSEEKQQKALHIVQCINSINPFNWISVGRNIKKQKPDVVIIKYWLPFMGPCFGTILRCIKRNTYTKVISIIDNIIPHESRIGDNMFTTYFVKPVDAFVAMSKSVMRDIEVFDTIKPKILSPHPLFDNFGESITREQALQKLNLSEEYRYILFFGIIREYKGLDILLQAFADKSLRNKPIKLIIAGEYYANKQKYTNMIEQLGLVNSIIQTNAFITDSEVKTYFNAADVVVQPYKTATQSGVTQIAYHFNKPMIVTNVGGLSELCPHKKVGYVVSPNPQSISEAIYNFFQEEKQINFVGNIIEEKKKYSWDILVKNIMNIFKKL